MYNMPGSLDHHDLSFLILPACQKQRRGVIDYDWGRADVKQFENILAYRHRDYGAWLLCL